jgi:hypothetical protein
MENDRRLNVRIPADLYREFKAETARHGITMSDAIRDMIDEWMGEQIRKGLYQSSFGVYLKMGDGAIPETFTAIAEVKYVDTDPPLERNGMTMDWPEILGVMPKTPHLWFDLLLLQLLDAPGVQWSKGLLNDIVNRTRRNFQLVVPAANSLIWTFSAYVIEFRPEFVNSRPAASMKLTIIDEPTLTVSDRSLK